MLALLGILPRIKIVSVFRNFREARLWLGRRVVVSRSIKDRALLLMLLGGILWSQLCEKEKQASVLAAGRRSASDC